MSITLFSKIYLFFIAIFVFAPFFVFAQSSPGSQVYLSTSPSIPEANSLVTVTLSYPLADLSRSNISWYVNNTLTSQGIGQTKVTVPMGDVGKRTLVGVSITTQDGRVVSQTLSLTPATIDLIWEASTYTPPLFKGKALPSAGSTLRINALTTFIKNGVPMDPQTLHYTWEVNGKILATGERGRSFLETTLDKNSSRTLVAVFVSTPDKTINGKETISIAEKKPEIVVYEKSPATGISYNKAITNQSTFSRKTITLVAEPFYIAQNIMLGGDFTWSINGTRATTDNESSTREVILSSQGSAQVIPVEFLISGGGLGSAIKKALNITL